MEQDPHVHSNQQQQQLSKRRQTQEEAQIQNENDLNVSEEFISLPYRKAYEMVETFAATRIGQFVMTRGDRLLKTVETTAKWSVPKAQVDYKLHRPLPWIPFLMLIITLRLARVWLSVAALVIGNSPIKADDVVYFIQTRRRKLRALRIRGIKEITRHETEKQSKEAGKPKNTLMTQLKKIFSSAICRPGQHRGTTEHRIFIVGSGEQPLVTENDPSDYQAAKRTRTDDDCDVNLTIDQMLSKYGDEVSDDDPDFIPNEADFTADTSHTSETESESETDEGEAVFDENASDIAQSTKDGNSQLNCSVEMLENGNNDETVPKPIIEIKQEIETDNNDNNDKPAKTPHENGPLNGGENRETDVAFKFVYTTPQPENIDNENFKTLMEAVNIRKNTPGHLSAALTKPLTTSTMNATAAANELTTLADCIPCVLNSTTTTTPTTNKNFPLTHTDSTSPTLSAASSSTSSLASFLINEEIVNKNIEFSTATSTPIHDTDDDIETDDLTSSKLTSISSSEDDFYSPIGSPPDFNAFQQRPSNFGFNGGAQNAQGKLPAFQKVSSEPNIGNPNKRNQHNRGNGNGNGTGHGNNGHHQHQRFKGRNRRQYSEHQI